MSRGGHTPGPDVPPVPALNRGDHIRAGWPGQIHHDGIYLGDGQVIHMVGQGKRNAHVQIGTLEAFAAGRPVTVRHYSGERDPDAIIDRAMSKLGDGGYNLVFNNCQHFARWCVTGEHLSEQVNTAAAATGTAIAPIVGVPVGIGVVGSVGLAEGLSGPGIMSGLAQCGAAVGGGAVAGMLLLGILVGGVSLAAMTPAFREDENLPEAERKARTGGRVGAVAGLAAGSAGSITAVSALGVPGLSGAGITSGLATLGAFFGGGMKTGVKCAIALPAVAAVIFGYAGYRLVRHYAANKPQAVKTADA